MSVSNSENLSNAIKIANRLKLSFKQKIPLVLGGNFIKTSEVKRDELNVFDLVTVNPEEVLKIYSQNSVA